MKILRRLLIAPGVNLGKIYSINKKKFRIKYPTSTISSLFFKKLILLVNQIKPLLCNFLLILKQLIIMQMKQFKTKSNN